MEFFRKPLFAGLAVLLLAIAAALAALPAASRAEGQNDIVVKTLENDGQLQILAVGSRPFTYKTLALTDPPRFVVDLIGVEVAAPTEFDVNNSNLVKSVRVGQNASSPPTVRLVLDLTELKLFPVALSSDGKLLAIGAPSDGDKIQAMADAEPELLAPAPVPAVPAGPKPLAKPDIKSGGREVTIAFDLPKESSPAARLAVEPDRLIVDLPGIELPAAEQSYKIEKGAVTAARVSPHPERPGDARIVVDLGVGLRHSVSAKGKKLIINLEQPAVMGHRIVVDAGHGGHDPGAEAFDGSEEKSYNLDTAMRLVALLKKAGAEVVATRSDDTFIPLTERAQIANRKKAEVFVSVHHNSLPKKPDIHGTEIYYFGAARSQKLAEIMAENMNGAMNSLDRGAREKGYLVLRNTAMRAVLCEIAYLTNERDLALVKKPAYRENAARGMFNGLEAWFGGKKHQLAAVSLPPGSGPVEVAAVPGFDMEAFDLIRTGRLKIPGTSKRVVMRRSY